MSYIEDKYAEALSVEQFEALLGNSMPLHKHHYEKNDVSSYAEEYQDRIPELNILIITEPWCGDSLAVVPTVLKFFKSFSQVEIRFSLRDTNLDLIDSYLTNGARAMPKFIIMDKDFNELFTFGPRPKAAQQIFEDHRQMIADGKIDKTDVHKKIRSFYAKDRGKSVISEFLANRIFAS